MSHVPRMRMFAGPNGSGKSTLKSVIRPELLGIYINPDEIEQEIGVRDFLDLKNFGVSTTESEILVFFNASVLLDKADLLDEAAYLRFSDDPIINISRVRNRVRLGGHSVPDDKVIARYGRSLGLLPEAIRHTDRAYIFDNSGPSQVWLAEVTDGRLLTMKTNRMPAWFKTAVWDKLIKLQDEADGTE